MSTNGFQAEEDRLVGGVITASRALTTLRNAKVLVGDTAAGYVFCDSWRSSVMLSQFPHAGDAREAALKLASGALVEKLHEGNPPTTTYIVKQDGIEFHFRDSELSAPHCRVEYVEEEVPAYTRTVAKVICDDPEEDDFKPFIAAD